jgi:hypothetical protein
MAKYGDLALKSVKYIKEFNLNVEEAWIKAAFEVFPNSDSSRMKGCPKNTFFGLCEDGLVLDVPMGKYTKSKKNKEYGLKALKLLNQQPELAEDQMRLWKIVAGDEKAYNYQMDVVVSLFKQNRLAK